MIRYRDKEQRYEIRVYVPDVNGKKTPKSFYLNHEKNSKGYKEALKLKFKIESEIADGKYVPTDKTLLKHYIDLWYDIHKKTLEETTKESYKIYIDKYIVPELGGIQIQKLKPIRIQEFYNSIVEKGMTANTVKHIHAVLNQVIKSALANKIIKEDPMLGVKLPKISKFEPFICTADVYKKIINSIKDSSIYTAIILAARTGLRRGEILGLRWSDVDFLNKTISIEQVLIRHNDKVEFKPYPKTQNSRRVITIDSVTYDALVKQKELCDTDKHKQKYKPYDLVVCRENGNYIRPDNLSEIFRKIADDCKYPKLRLHDLRHFNASLMVMAGVDVKTAAERFGDRPDTMLKIYTHTHKEMERQAAQKINDLLQ